MTSLIEFLEAPLDEDEQAALAAGDDDHVHASGGRPACPSERCAHDIRHNPKRTLREVKAHRSIVSQYRLLRPFDLPKSLIELFELYVRDIARIYADHPDFRAEWDA